MDSCENGERWLNVQVLPMKADAMFRWDKKCSPGGTILLTGEKHPGLWTRCLIVSGTTNRQYRR